MYLSSIELIGFKSFGKKSELVFTSPIASIVGPNGSGKSNVAEAFRFVLGEQSMKSLRSKKGEDLIWGGSPGLPRANRAAVKVVFDNTKRFLDLDFNEVVVERVVHRDGQNEYLLNGTAVRLKDVVRLLAGANIGGSGYQIISQGEADRILNASPKERREMVEDALGLKLFQHKKAESEKKLEETAQNIDKTKSLRRELAPHINFLRQQVEKIEKAREMKDDLAVRLNDYLAREDAWITQEDARILDELRACEAEIRMLEAQAELGDQGDASPASTLHLEEKIRAGERELSEARDESARLVRELGRAEGALQTVQAVRVEHSVSGTRARSFAQELETLFALTEGMHDLSEIRAHIAQARARIAAFIEEIAPSAPREEAQPTALAQQHMREIAEVLERAQAREADIVRGLESLRRELSEGRQEAITAARKGAEAHALVREARAKMSFLQSQRSQVGEKRERFEEEVREGIVLIGAAIHGWKDSAKRGEIPDGALSEDRSVQEKRRRDIERLKIKIEEAGAGDSEAVMREFADTQARDQFLARELADLEKSAHSLHGIIAELEETIDKRFTDGLGLINEALQSFFSKLFGGGEAKLHIESPARGKRDPDELDEETETEEETPYAGLSISVSLPRKKVRGLEVLSGGERALTSIAMIFAMSRVNPPPFLILDETDAALDEANSRRYADMIRELGLHSQLIVITHNRATMAAAGELYGVTMGQDGVSKLLSVKLEEAERVAK